jgi:DNA-binding response OmpR family regulator
MRRVLLVDDNLLVQRAIARVLQRAGFDITSAEDVPEASGLLLAQQFDLLLCDLQLPSGSGRDVVATARAVAPSMKVLLLSGANDVEAGDPQQLSKPIGGRELVAAIELALAG